MTDLRRRPGMRARLLEIVAPALTGLRHRPGFQSLRPERIVDMLLPVVRRLVADELRSIADDPEHTWVAARSDGQVHRVVPVSRLYARAAVLEDPEP